MSDVRQLFESYVDDLVTATVCFLGGDLATAEDVVQTVFVSSVKKSWAEVKNPKAYLTAACLNRARDELRRRTRQPIELAERDVVSTVDSPVQNIVDTERQKQIFTALLKLPDEQREVVSLRIYGGLSFREIADSARIPVATARSRYRYAIAELKRLPCINEV